MKPTEMHTEINGNPPTVTKRKKNRDKKQSTKLDTSDLNPSYCNYFSSNLNSHPNLNMSDNTSYYSILNHSVPSEPMSLPIYPFAYPHLSYPTPNYFNGLPKPPVMPSVPSLNSESHEYMSLPVGTVNQNDSMSKRRFSDPGLPNDSDSSTNSFEGRLIQKLTQQVQALRENNRKLSQEVMEMRMELNLLKQQQSTRHFEREYEPGMLADVIREVRDAARVREDALLARVKHMIEERQLSISQLHLVAEKNRNNDRISKLEEQMKNLTMTQNRSDDGNSLASSSSAVEEGSSAARQVLELEREALVLRRELQDARAKKEESDQRLLQLDKKLFNILRRSGEVNGYEGSEDGKTTSIDSFSVNTASSSVSQTPAPPRVTLSGPVTDL